MTVKNVRDKIESSNAIMLLNGKEGCGKDHSIKQRVFCSRCKEDGVENVKMANIVDSSLKNDSSRQSSMVEETLNQDLTKSQKTKMRNQFRKKRKRMQQKHSRGGSFGESSSPRHISPPSSTTSTMLFSPTGSINSTTSQINDAIQFNREDLRKSTEQIKVQQMKENMKMRKESFDSTHSAGSPTEPVLGRRLSNDNRALEALLEITTKSDLEKEEEGEQLGGDIDFDSFLGGETNNEGNNGDADFFSDPSFTNYGFGEEEEEEEDDVYKKFAELEKAGNNSTNANYQKLDLGFGK